MSDHEPPTPHPVRPHMPGGGAAPVRAPQPLTRPLPPTMCCAHLPSHHDGCPNHPSHRSLDAH